MAGTTAARRCRARGVVAVGLLAGLAACAPRPAWIHPYGAADPGVGRIVEVESGARLDEAALVARLARARFVLLGETHDNADHHRLQARLIRALAARPPGVAVVVFEMLEVGQEEAVARHLRGPEADLAAFARAVRWEDRGWPDFALYEPVFRAALEAGARVMPGDLPRARVRRVARDGYGALDATFLDRSGLARPLPPPLRRRLEAVLEEAHCFRLARDFLPRLVRVQRARDAMLADRMVAAAADGEGRVVLITGKGHARTDFGVPWYLRARGIEDVASLGFVEVGEAGGPDRADLPFDYVWFTPRAHPPGDDPCRGIRPRGRSAGLQRHSGSGGGPVTVPSPAATTTSTRPPPGDRAAS